MPGNGAGHVAAADSPEEREKKGRKTWAVTHKWSQRHQVRLATSSRHQMSWRRRASCRRGKTWPVCRIDQRHKRTENDTLQIGSRNQLRGGRRQQKESETCDMDGAKKRSSRPKNKSGNVKLRLPICQLVDRLIDYQLRYVLHHKRRLALAPRRTT